MFTEETSQSTFVRRAIVPFAAVALFLVGCSDSPTEVEDEDHVEAFGFAIESEGAEILRYMDATGGIPELALQAGVIYELAVVFLDADGDPLPHEEHEGEEEEEEELRVTIGNPAILAWTPEEHEEEEEEHDHLEFHGELEALAAGSSGLQLCILHVDHCDYESPVIQVDVE